MAEDIGTLLDLEERRRRQFAAMPSADPNGPASDFNAMIRRPDETLYGIDPAQGASPLQPSVERFPMLKRYEQRAQWAPDAAAYQPGKLARLAAIASGASAGAKYGGGAGFETAQSILRTPYRDALERYNQEMQGLGTAANVESTTYARGEAERRGRFEDMLKIGHLNVAQSHLGLEAGKNAEDIRWHNLENQGTVAREHALENNLAESTRQHKAELGLHKDQLQLGRDTLGERSRHNKAMELRPVGGSKAADTGVKPKDQETIEKLAMARVRLSDPELYQQFVTVDPVSKKPVLQKPTDKPGMLWGRNPLSNEERLRVNADWEKLTAALNKAKEDITVQAGKDYVTPERDTGDETIDLGETD